MKKKIVILSGAGISAESGIETFRSSNGTWNNFKVEDVATSWAIKNNTQTCFDFYNQRKNQMIGIEPNKAHHILKEMENDFDITILTQNVDNLHEKANSSNIIHLHGELSKLRSSNDANYKIDYINDLKIGDLCPEGYQLRPHIVLFDEELPSKEYNKAINEIKEADVVIIIGTSLQVQPAASIPWFSKENTLIFYVDPSDDNIYIPKERKMFFNHYKEKATIGMQIIYNDLKEIFY